VRGDAQASAWIQATRAPIAGRLQVQALADPLTNRQSGVNLEGSYAAGILAGQILYVGQLGHWWGPGQDGSLIWSTAGLAIPGVGLRRAEETPFETRWLSWVGPWSYEIFLGRMQHNVLVPGTRVFSMRLQAQPLPGLELGASRLIHWGGSIGDNSFSSLADAFLGRSNDPGDVNNEIAGFDARYTWLPGGNPLSVYGQFIGEDEAGKLPTKYLSQVGAEYKHMLGTARLHWHLEAADTMTGRLFGLQSGRPGIAYSHSQYRDGMYHEGLPIAHFIGGDGRAYSLGLNVTPVANRFRLRYGLRFTRAQVNESNRTINLAFPTSDTVQLAELTASWEMPAPGSGPLTVHAGLNVLRSKRNGNDAGVRLALELPF
jgi:hypothetical protein